MAETGEHAALAAEARLAHWSSDGEAQKLDRGFALESPVAPSRQPDGAHATLADRSLEHVRAEGLPGERGRRGNLRGVARTEEVRRIQRVFAFQQGFEIRNDARVRNALRLEPGGAGLGRHVERFIEQPTELTPFVPTELLHCLCPPELLRGIDAAWSRVSRDQFRIR